MSDCNKTENFLKEYHRMCKSFKTYCPNCPFYKLVQLKTLTCIDILEKYPQEAIKTVQKWSDEHPQKTYLEDMKEKFPKLNENSLFATICPKDFYGDAAKNKYVVCDNDCRKCWNQSMKE